MQGHADPLHVGWLLRAVPEPLQGDDHGRRLLLHLQRLRQLPGLEGGVHVSRVFRSRVDICHQVTWLCESHVLVTSVCRYKFHATSSKYKTWREMGTTFTLHCSTLYSTKYCTQSTQRLQWEWTVLPCLRSPIMVTVRFLTVPISLLGADSIEIKL